MAFFLKPTVSIAYLDPKHEAGVRWLKSAEEHPSWPEKKNLISVKIQYANPPSLKFIERDNLDVIASLQSACETYIPVNGEPPDVVVLMDPRTWQIVPFDLVLGR